MERFLLAFANAYCTRDVRYWPKADIPTVAISVRFREYSGHDFHQPARPLMTHIDRSP
jgi:hypothetical protein